MRSHGCKHNVPLAQRKRAGGKAGGNRGSGTPDYNARAMSSTARRLVHWLVLFAMALSSAAPAFAGRGSAADLAALDICTLDRGDAAAGDLGHAPADRSPLHHCLFCAPAAHAALPAAPPSLVIAPAEVAAFVLPCPASPERAVRRGSTCRPRGPPQRA